MHLSSKKEKTSVWYYQLYSWVAVIYWRIWKSHFYVTFCHVVKPYGHLIKAQILLNPPAFLWHLVQYSHYERTPRFLYKKNTSTHTDTCAHTFTEKSLFCLSLRNWCAPKPVFIPCIMPPKTALLNGCGCHSPYKLGIRLSRSVHAHRHTCMHPLHIGTHQYGKWQKIQAHKHRKDETRIFEGNIFCFSRRCTESLPYSIPLTQKHIQEHKHSPLSWGMKPAQCVCTSRWLSHRAREQWGDKK